MKEEFHLKKIIKKEIYIISFFLIGLLSFFVFSVVSSAAASPVIYDAEQMETFRNRTVEEVADRYSKAWERAGNYLDEDSSTWYETEASVKYPYAPGVLTQDTHDAMTAMADLYRWLIGVPTLQGGSSHSESMQAQALVRNFQFDHIIDASSKPADMDDALWDLGEPCNHSILARFYTPRGAISGWINEGYSLSSKSWDTIGHRYILLSYGIQGLEFGYSGSIAVGRSYAVSQSENEMKEAFAAFPAPGYMPKDLISPVSSVWSVQLNPQKIRIEDERSVTVKVTNLSTNQTYTCSAAADTLTASGGVVAFVQPSDYEDYEYNDNYRVEISGLKDVATQNEARIQYVVRFTDIVDHTASNVVKAESTIKEYAICRAMSDDESLQKVAAILPDEVDAETTTGRHVLVPVKGRWTVDKKNQCFVNSCDKSRLPENVTDKNGILDYITISYRVDDGYESYNSLSLSENVFSAGRPLTFYVYRTNVSTDTTRIFKLFQNEDGTYRAEKKYDSATSEEFSAADSERSFPNHVYNKAYMTENDIGEYISVYFNSDEVDWGGIVMHVSCNTAILSKYGDSDTEINPEGDSEYTYFKFFFPESDQKGKNKNIRIEGISHNIAAGRKIRLSLETADGSTPPDVVWKSSNPKIATVNQNGVVTLKKKSGGQSVRIIAKALDGSGIKTTYRIKSMKGIVRKVTIAGAKKRSIRAGKKLKLKAKVSATRGANKKIQWFSSNTRYATVSASGKVKTKKAGKGRKVKITAMATDGSNKKNTVTIKIK